MASQKMFGSSNFKVKIAMVNDGVTTYYGGCAATVTGDWNTNATVLIAPDDGSAGNCTNPDYHILFGDTVGTITLSQLMLGCPNDPISSELYKVILEDAETLTITATVPNDDNSDVHDYVIEFKDIAYNLGESYGLTQISDNLYFSKTVTYQILKENSGSPCDVAVS